ncbi:MAG: DUF2975 domain-containing protein [Clostridia bacterium]|nr:DUF2975 domain-containing protein [Clostridia bacterium]
MLKPSNKVSCYISMALAALFFLALIGCAFGLVPYMDAVIGLGKIHDGQKPVILGIGYAILAIAAGTDILLFALLKRVREEAVFTSESVSLLRWISWCCIAAGILFAALGIWFLISYAVAFVAVLVGICLRVVKNVIAEAAEIKSENDLTV